MDELDKLQEAKWTPTVDVFIQVSYTKIYEIDTINQRFQAEAIIESKWHDPSVTSTDDKIDTDEIWTPGLYIDNAIKDLHEDISYKIVPDRVSKKFLICEMRKVRGIFWENLELENFPLPAILCKQHCTAFDKDVQDLSVLIATKKPGEIVKFIVMQPTLNNLRISNTLDRSMWQMHNIVITKLDRIKREYSYGPREYPCVRVTSQVFRSPGFFYWNAVLPVLLVTIASICPFVIDIKLPQSRLPATATMLLTSVSMRWIVGRFIPTVSYLTSLDKYSLSSTVIITMLLLYHATIAALLQFISTSFAYRIDKAAFVVFFLLIIVKQIWFLVWIGRANVYRRNVRKNKKLHIIDEDLGKTMANGSGIRTKHKQNLLDILRKQRPYSLYDVANISEV